MSPLLRLGRLCAWLRQLPIQARPARLLALWLLASGFGALPSQGQLPAQDRLSTKPTEPGLPDSDASLTTAVAQFNQRVAPLLASRCLSCHSGSQPKGNLDLSTREAALKGGDSGPSIEPGPANKSLLWQRVASDEMPPKKPLTHDEREILRQWLSDGAAWSDQPIELTKWTSESRAGMDWWSLQPLTNQSPPDIRPEDLRASQIDFSKWQDNPIDRFVWQQLRKVNLTPSPQADKRTLIRRVTMDLTGLPPTLEQMHAFLQESDEKAYERLVDRLLDTPHYGERTARAWLDLVRFGESNGFEYDEPRDNFWPYRNWVIDALNSDMPYDQFARMQIAGDALAPDELHAAAATGFLVAGPHNTTLPSNTKMRMAMAQDELEDLVGNIGQTFLGLTINCARCHDHKYDPISQKEYYQLVAALSGVTHGQRSFQVELKETQRARLAVIEEQLRQRRSAKAAIVDPVRERIRTARDTGKLILTPPTALATWEFDGDLKDSRGKYHLTARNGAKVENGALVLSGKQAFAVSPLLSKEITEKSLEAWVRLTNLDQRGGGVISLETTGGAVFDAIVFGEQQPKNWLAGSNNFVRTRSFNAQVDENDAQSRTVHVAIVYAADGSITAYRDGVLYGAAYSPGQVATYAAGTAHLLLGLRHSPAGGNRSLAGRIERAQFYDRALTSEEVALSFAYQDADNIPADMIRQQLSSESAAQVDQLDREIVALKEERDSIEHSRHRSLYTCVSGKPGETHVLVRGEVSSPAEQVQPAGIKALAMLEGDFRLQADASDRQRRLALANWIASERNPLFARTIVNRLWQFHFGQGLVTTPSDLGFSGGVPAHRDLLDWLAGELQRSGYRLKAIHRAIVTSATYRQASQARENAMRVDNENRYLWRKSPLRLDAEAIRDAMLVTAQRLDREVGGEGYRDMRHYFYKGSNFYEPVVEDGSKPLRRTIYRFTPRGGHNLFLDTFDCPDPSSTAPRRATTTTPLQALALLNNALIFDMADALADRLRDQAGTDVRQQIALAYQVVYGREIREDESEDCRRFVSEQGLPAFCRVLFNSNEFLTIR